MCTCVCILYVHNVCVCVILLPYQSAVNQRHQLKIVYAWLVGDLSVTCS